MEKVRKKYRLPRQFILYVGDVNYHKNILSLVKACKSIKLPLVIVGKQAAQKAFDKNHVESQPLVQLIKLTMRLSKKQINPNLKKQIHRLLFQSLADFHTTQEVEKFLKGFLTKTELDVLAKRLAVAYYLNKGRSYQNIKTNLAVSSATISSIAEQVKKGSGFEMALKKIKADEWADEWAKKIGKMVKRRRK